jgi:hypothetical protein
MISTVAAILYGIVLKVKKAPDWQYFICIVIILLSVLYAVYKNVFDSPELHAVLEIQNDLRSPSSFTEIDKSVVWQGKFGSGYDAYVVKVDYEAMNGFGGMNRECNLVALWDKNGTWYHNSELYKLRCRENNEEGVKLLVDVAKFRRK